MSHCTAITYASVKSNVVPITSLGDYDAALKTPSIDRPPQNEEGSSVWLGSESRVAVISASAPPRRDYDALFTINLYSGRWEPQPEPAAERH